MPRLSEFFGVPPQRIAPLDRGSRRCYEFGLWQTLGTLVWPNGADLCPDVLVMRAKGISVEEFLGRTAVPA